MEDISKITKLVFDAVTTINDQVDEDLKLNLARDTVLFGEESKLDSIGLVNLIVTVEQNIEDEFDISLTLADEEAMSQEQSPFRSIGALIDYVTKLLKDLDK